MTDRELLEQIHSDMNARFAALEGKIDARFAALEGKIDVRFDKLYGFLEKQFEIMDGRIDLVMQELVSVKILTKSRMDRMETRIEQLEQRTR